MTPGAAHLPGFSETPAVAVLMVAAAVSILGLPLSATVITLLLTAKAGIATAPLIIVAVLVAYLTIKTLSATRTPAAPATEPSPPSAPGQGRLAKTRVTVRHDHQEQPVPAARGSRRRTAPGAGPSGGAMRRDRRTPAVTAGGARPATTRQLQARTTGGRSGAAHEQAIAGAWC